MSLLSTPPSRVSTPPRKLSGCSPRYPPTSACEPDAFATVALKLAEYRKLAPGKLEEFVFFDQPSGYSRIFMSMRWKAEHLPESASPAKP